jgi:methyl-accepting chemotaxis protein
VDKAIIVAKEISLASNNAGVLAVRAGTDAAGFGALAEFLDQLARKTIQASNEINQQAMEISKLTTNAVRTETAAQRYEDAFEKGKDATHIDSLRHNFGDIQKQVSGEYAHITSLTNKLSRGLEVLKQELDVGKVLASMSLVEASQAGKEFTAHLTDNAKNIASAIERIEVHVNEALKLMKMSRLRNAQIK